MTEIDQGHRSIQRPELERPEIVQTSVLQQSLSITRRNLIHIKRMPEMLLDVTIQPVMFVLLFAFVFGSSISIDTDAGSRQLTAPAEGLGHMTRVAGIFDQSEIVLDDIGLKRPSLDDVFLHLTGHRAEERPDDTDETAGEPAGEMTR